MTTFVSIVIDSGTNRKTLIIRLGLFYIKVRPGLSNNPFFMLFRVQKQRINFSSR